MYIVILRISVCAFLLLLSLSLARRICPARTPWVTEVLGRENCKFNFNEPKKK